MKKRTYIILLTVFAVFIAPVLILGWILQTISTLLAILGHLSWMEPRAEEVKWTTYNQEFKRLWKVHEDNASPNGVG